MHTNSNNKNIIFGRNPVKEALRSNRLIKAFVLNSFKDAEIINMLKSNKINPIFVSQDELNKLSNFGAHQGIAGEIKGYSYSSLDEIIHLSKKSINPIVVILDGIEDPHNLGAIIRSSDVFGVTGIIIPKYGSATINATVEKTSAGAISYAKVAIVSNLNQAIKELKDNGFWVVSSDGSAKILYTDLKYDFPTCLVIGSEGKGVSKLVLSNSDYIVKIPQYGHVNSLNASVAAGILLSKIKG